MDADAHRESGLAKQALRRILRAGAARRAAVCPGCGTSVGSTETAVSVGGRRFHVGCVLYPSRA